MRAWAEHGLGISLLPRFAVADSLRAGTLIQLDLPLPDLSLRLVWREDRESLPACATSSTPPPAREPEATRLRR
jgi:DNA-binding transcriptional LysR family regulator